jgi:hypothetical protein
MKDAKFNDFVKPCIYGFVQIHNFVTLRDKKFAFIQLARRDTRRLGKKLISRGLDSLGNAANFAISETIIIR